MDYFLFVIFHTLLIDEADVIFPSFTISQEIHISLYFSIPYFCKISIHIYFYYTPNSVPLLNNSVIERICTHIISEDNYCCASTCVDGVFEGATGARYIHVYNTDSLTNCITTDVGFIYVYGVLYYGFNTQKLGYIDSLTHCYM